MRICTRSRYLFSHIFKYGDALEKHYKKNDLLTGYCNPSHSKHYSQRNKEVHTLNWRTPNGINDKLTLSSIGIGTYNGQPSNQYDYEMFRAIADSLLSGGVNMIDTDPLFRYGKSQKVINAVLNYLTQEKGYRREQFFVSTKCGYIPHDIDSNLKEQDFIGILTAQKIVNPEDIIHGTHCISPNFLQFSVQKSRFGLGLQTIDLVYLNNYSEAHLPIVGETVTYQRLKQAFIKFEEMRAQNRIRYYGISSYVGLRSPKTQLGIHFRLQKVIRIAKQVGGKDHGFRFAMVPFSLGTPQVLLKWQEYFDGTSTKDLSVFDIAKAENVNIVSCGPLFQGKVVPVPFQSKLINYLQHNSARHLQLIRSYPSSSLLTTLVGMVQSQHVQENLSILKHPTLTQQQWKQILPIPE